MVHLLEDCNLCAIHAKRVTISAFFTAIPVLQVVVCVCRTVDPAGTHVAASEWVKASHAELIGIWLLHLQCRRTSS
jgi:hypothetical protein